MNSSSHVLSKWWLIWIFSYNGWLAIYYCKALITRCFHILTNPHNCLGCGDVLPAHIPRLTSSTKVVFDSNKVSNGPGFWGKSIEYPQTPVYIPRLKLLLGFNFKIVTIGYAFAITVSLVDIRSSKKQGSIGNITVASYWKCQTWALYFRLRKFSNHDKN